MTLVELARMLRAGDTISVKLRSDGVRVTVRMAAVDGEVMVCGHGPLQLLEPIAVRTIERARAKLTAEPARAGTSSVQSDEDATEVRSESHEKGEERHG